MSAVGPSFVLMEDFRASNTPGTVIENLAGVRAFSFGRGDARAFRSLLRSGRVVSEESIPGPKDLFRTRYGVRP
ncbi:MAG TPA: hypothetical protein VMN04_02550 [Thermoanaerobaculia bacterium]|nr:hypothetical protein [Thermoanaerobaculia bacterium]